MSPEQEVHRDKNTPSEYPRGIPWKFDKDGNVQPFPGNTIVCHLSQTSDLYASLLQLYEKLRTSPLAHLYTLLPPPSWHMTVFEGVCDQVRKPGYWPSDLPVDAPLEECTARFAEELSAFDLRCDPPYRISVRGIDPLQIGIGVHLEFTDAAEEALFRGLRDRISETLSLRLPGHETYGLHISIAYLLRILTDEQDAEIRKLVLDHLGDAPKEVEFGAPDFYALPASKANRTFNDQPLTSAPSKPYDSYRTPHSAGAYHPNTNLHSPARTHRQPRRGRTPGRDHVGDETYSAAPESVPTFSVPAVSVPPNTTTKTNHHSLASQPSSSSYWHRWPPPNLHRTPTIPHRKRLSPPAHWHRPSSSPYLHAPPPTSHGHRHPPTSSHGHRLPSSPDYYSHQPSD
ncbi:RNA ligase/cyclic nucleotide phosphodiesterase [Coniochaeta sp. 2T2.1]|nr:RNA ligase/cyclic nucleotide phosphodiesterase [Coniochaeta sp. 2T2.1]